MGLDTSHDCWHGAYSAFMRFRRAIAKSIGVPLDLMEGFYEGLVPMYATVTPPMALDRLTRIESEYMPLRWESMRPDPLHVLLHHSDCDGDIAVADLKPLAERLEAIAPQLGEWSEHAIQFAKGCRLAARRRQKVQFR